MQIQAIEIASKPLQEELARATDEEEIKIIKMKMLELTYVGLWVEGGGGGERESRGYLD